MKVANNPHGDPKNTDRFDISRYLCRFATLRQRCERINRIHSYLQFKRAIDRSVKLLHA